MAQKERGGQRAPSGGASPTELDQLRAELAQSEARFRNIIERTADGVIILGPDHHVRFVNPAAEALFGRSAASLLDSDFGLALVAGETAEMDLVRPGPGEPLVAELRVSDTMWEGEPAQLISLRDITDRRRAEERAQRLLLERAAREEAERTGRRAAFLAEAVAELDASLDPRATLVALSRLIVPRLADWCVIDLIEGDAVRRVAGLHADPTKQPLLDELSRRYPARRDSGQPVARVLRSGVPELLRELDEEQVRLFAQDDDHARLVLELGVRSTMILPLRVRQRAFGSMTIVCAEREFDAADLALARDLADRASQAYENARLYEAALAANKARSDFLAVVSHELRTPLNAIVGYTQLLLTRVSGDPDAFEVQQLERIEWNALHLLHIIQKILTFASMEAARVEAEVRPVRLGDLIDDVAALAGPLARGKKLDFGVRVKDQDAEMLTDAGKIRQITIDLLTNAVKFTDEGGIELRARLEDGNLVIQVEDTGRGMEAEDLANIFEPFWQAEGSLTRIAGGTGLGLTVSRRLAQILGGDITVRTAPGAGSTFTLRVPARAPADSTG